MDYKKIWGNIAGLGRKGGAGAYRAATSRQARFGTNSLVSILAFAGILIIANLIVRNAGWRLDTTKNKLNSLSPESVKVLESIKKPVKVYVFNQANAQQEAKDLLKLYSSKNSNIKVEYVDPYSNRSLAEQYKITRVGTTLFTIDNRSEQTTNTTESDYTTALLKLQNPKKVKVAFWSANGEKNTDDPSDAGYSTLKETLEKLNYEVVKQDSLKDSQIASDAGALIIAGPQTPYVNKQLDMIKSYLSSGGKALVMLDATRGNIKTGLEDILVSYGIDVKPGIVIEQNPELFYRSPLNPGVKTFEPHQITEGLSPAIFAGAEEVKAAGKLPDNATVQSLMKSSSDSWFEVSPLQLDQEPQKNTSNGDVNGPISMGVAMNFTAPKDNKDNKYKTRLVVLGDSDLASNVIVAYDPNKELVNPANLDLVVNSINWLTSQEGLYNIVPKDRTPPSITLSDAQQSQVMYLVLVGIPLLSLLIGFVVWRMRRQNRLKK
ncbi:MAG: GldG family protein [bacterium]|nr:GldG family protein [bacterium]